MDDTVHACNGSIIRVYGVAMNAVERIIYTCEVWDITIVSYGLAPNPSGFCFETGQSTTNSDAERFSVMLDELSSEQEKNLREVLFK